MRFSKARVPAAFTAVLLSTALLTTACSSTSGDKSDSTTFTVEASEVLTEPWQELFDGEKEAVVATPERLFDGAQKAVEKGIPLFVNAVPEDLSNQYKDVIALEGEPETPNPENLVQAIAELPEDNPRYESIPPVLVTAETDPAAIATARAAGADIEVLPVADPRASDAAVKGEKVLAIGEQFGDQQHFSDLISLADNGELPGGGGLVFPGRRMVALYGHAASGDLGILGEGSPEESVAKAKELVAQYQPLTDEPVIPAFEIIATVAAGEPGEDGDYSNEPEVEELRPYVEAIGKAGGYAVIDLQPGRAKFIDQAKRYEELLKLPYVGLALDPEWKLKPDQVPLEQIGEVSPQEVNEVSDWFAKFIRDNNLPQKALVIHQFKWFMLGERSEINLDHPEIAFTLHVDGHGTPEDKEETWNVLKKDLDPRWFLAWKNFFDEDQPMFTPEQTYAVDPRPWFVSYQ